MGQENEYSVRALRFGKGKIYVVFNTTNPLAQWDINGDENFNCHEVIRPPKFYEEHTHAIVQKKDIGNRLELNFWQKEDSPHAIKEGEEREQRRRVVAAFAIDVDQIPSIKKDSAYEITEQEFDNLSTEIPTIERAKK
jgi:hypothetical protein